MNVFRKQYKEQVDLSGVWCILATDDPPYQTNVPVPQLLQVLSALKNLLMGTTKPRDLPVLHLVSLELGS